ncbi:MAG: DNA-directed RNA polymerase subunit beta [Acidobacteriia bacterium]|nr:DNA-directed RNA polymerase subunit beta [Terriglobia bacterium]
MGVASNGRLKERVEFSKIETSIQIPNLIEIQKKSYAYFLQMGLLPQERQDIGLQAVFNSVFPISDFRGVSSLEFVDYSIGNWECKCGSLKGLSHLRTDCKSCGSVVVTNPFSMEKVVCSVCGADNKNVASFCEECGDPVSLKRKFDVAECQERGMTYAAPLKVNVRLTTFDKDPDTGEKAIRDIKEQEVYFGEIPLMTDNGTFVINGTERVVVSQLHRSPGVFFEAGSSKNYLLGKLIPYRGSWVEFEYDQKNILYVRIDRKRKFLGSVFLRALGLKSDEELIRAFYTTDSIKISGKQLFWNVSDTLIGMKISHNVVHPKTKEILCRAGKQITHSQYNSITKARISKVEISPDDLEGFSVVSDVVSPETGEILLEVNSQLTPPVLVDMIDYGISEFSIFNSERDDVGVVLSQTIKKDNIKTTPEALIEIYRRLRPGDPPTLETATNLFEGIFFDPRKYDFSRVGRLKMNIKLDLNTPLGKRNLEPRDFYAVITYLLKLGKNIGNVDDIDHLGNRRVRAVGELLENQFRIGLVRMERAIKEKMSVYQEIATAMPHDLINAKPVIAAVREFFGSSQLSQFMDQTNPLSEITHKRRLSALGPGGLSRERAGFEVRDVHTTHYGRICPIETPEGPNIGLISSLSCYARINEFGFIESPYRKVKNARIVDYVTVTNGGDSSFKIGEHLEQTVVENENRFLKTKNKRMVEFEPYSFYLTAWEEDKYIIAQANLKLDQEGNLEESLVNARQAGNFVLKNRDEIDYVDVSPKQLVSVAASLIPFLENDDANRALMGSNMQRQAVPLLRAEAPYVGTGMEKVTAHDSGAVVLCRRSGIVDSVDSERIIVRVDTNGNDQLSREVGADIYQLKKFRRSNQNTCINQKPIVLQGDRVDKEQVIADGPCTDFGELALGRNILVAFMPWRGYNFEDAILVSEKLVKDDYYTSIHIEEFDIEARDTKLGPEEITRDIPNVGESVLKDLDSTGIIRIGASVNPGDVIVGKVTPKGETQLTPEEKLLRAIFGEKAGDVRDASLVTPPGIEGVVVDVKIFSRKGQEKDDRAKVIEEEEIERLEKNLNDEIRILTDERNKRLCQLLEGTVLTSDLKNARTGKRILTKRTTLNREIIQRLSAKDLARVKVDRKNVKLEEQVLEVEEMMTRQIEVMQKIQQERINQFKSGDELPPGVIKLVKVFVAMKRKLSVGDKMAGRHGNKGVIARILPEEDMPYLPDGTSVEIVLNPLGVPSRMNVGQILETHLGWAAKALGLHFATPVFDGASEKEIKSLLEDSKLPSSGKTALFDGMTGDRFEQKVTVGYIYMLKLSHLVDDKIHARSIGPYSLITQQPLGGKAQFGGQRFGEMEVWALEGYGAAHILQELLTAKADDVYGRSKIYEAIVKGESAIEAGLPESFNVLIRELQSLCLDIELLRKYKNN